MDRFPQNVLIVLLALAAFLHPLRAQDAAGVAEKSVESPSPNGKYAFLATHQPDGRTVDLIEKSSGKILLRVAESEDDSDELTTSVLWSPDSRRFAITETYHNRRVNDLDVFLRAGDAFQEATLPDLPEAAIPVKFANDKDHFWHMNVIDWHTPLRWSKDGSLVVEIETTIDGNDNYATAKRTVVLGFDRAGAATILKSTQKVTTRIEIDH